MKLEQLANKTVVVVTVNDPVDLAIQHMWRLNIRHLPVVRGNVPVGMVSDRDVLFHVCWLDHAGGSGVDRQGDPASGASRIDQIMTSPAIVLSPQDPIEKAARLMLNKRISSIPLAADNSIVGIVTESDFLRCYNNDACLVPSQTCRQDGIDDHMSAHVFTVQTEDATLTAIRLMRDKEIRHLVVMDKGAVAGIISDRDVLRGSPRDQGEHAITVAELRSAREVQVQGIMSTSLEVLPLSSTLSDAAKRMAAHKIGALPVVENGDLIGIITETDLLRAFVADCTAATN